ncbi:MAG TPA: hypothetical protein VFZ48_02155 [Candidatus Saccharimonadales bacterium]
MTLSYEVVKPLDIPDAAFGKGKVTIEVELNYYSDRTWTGVASVQGKPAEEIGSFNTESAPRGVSEAVVTAARFWVYSYCEKNRLRLLDCSKKLAPYEPFDDPESHGVIICELERR